MGRPRKSTELHELSGAFKRNPGRAKAREGEPKITRPLGPPPGHWNIPDGGIGFQRAAELRAIWAEFAEIGFWLKDRNRSTMESFCEYKYDQRHRRLNHAGMTYGAVSCLGVNYA
jgi:hypothetical protein